MRPKWIREIAKLLGQSTCCEAPFMRAVVDTRKLEVGDLFFALPGARVDGHQFLEVAAAKGAVAAVVHHSYQGPNFGLPLIPVADVLQAIQALGAWRMGQSRVQTLAITGSLGKTTTKDFVVAFLSTQYRVASTPENYNSKITLPLSVLNAADGEEVWVLEMGMTHPGQIRRLTELCPPDMALITHVALSHAGNFAGLEEIAAAKAEIFSQPKTETAIFAHHLKHYPAIQQLKKMRSITFSTKERSADYFLEERDGGLFLTEFGKTYQLPPLKVLGKHNQHNLLAAMTLARTYGLGWEQIQATIPQLVLPGRRLQLSVQNGVTILSDAYNASQESTCAALDALPQPSSGGRRIGLLADMVELGKFSEECHRMLGQYAAEKLDALFCVGKGALWFKEEWEKRGKPVLWFETREEAVQACKAFLRPLDVVLVKGSRVWALEEIVQELA